MTEDRHIILVKEIPHEPMRFWCASSTRPGQTHVVDLSQNAGNGSCQCEDFIARRQPAINDGKQLFTDQTSCKHVRAARNFWMEYTLRSISKMIKENNYE